jgi:low affinity Fe/Cu permease
MSDRRGPFDRFADWTERHVASITFLLVALFANMQRRSDKRVEAKLDRLIEKLDG